MDTAARIAEARRKVAEIETLIEQGADVLGLQSAVDKYKRLLAKKNYDNALANYFGPNMHGPALDYWLTRARESAARLTETQSDPMRRVA